MAIRDDKNGLTEQARKYTDQIDAALKPIFENCIKDGLNREDFFFLVAAEAHEIILDDVLGL